jgi:outer membrane scaffolding protein for murein synthesis (MipA/OmpV family)
MYKPEYEGSDDYGFKGFPLIDISWRDTIFLNARKGLGAYLWNRNDVKFGGSIGYNFGRDEDDSNDLDGLGDIDGGGS